jgi:hypothetical protein
MATQKKLAKPEKLPETIGFRFTPEDRLLLAALKQHLGVQSMSDIVRQGLRALATKEGVSA